MQNRNDDTSKVRLEVVTDGEAGQRIDNFLHKRAPGVPRSHIYRVIRKGQVRVNGGRVKPAGKLCAGDQVRIPPMSLRPKASVRVPDKLVDAVASSVFFENGDFLALNKPPGLAVHAGSSVPFGVIDALRQALDAPQLELVHRIDRGTSGCLLVARDTGTNRQLQNLFRERQVGKRYRAWVHGRWTAGPLTVDVPLLANKEQAGERRVIVSSQGQAAISRFTPLACFDGGSEMQVDIETGRTHQIRVHAKHAGHAIIGDTRYADNALNAACKKRGLGRLFLHAHRLVFEWQGEELELCAPFDEQWQLARDVLGDGAHRSTGGTNAGGS